MTSASDVVLTASELAELTQMYTQARLNDGVAYWQIYQYLAGALIAHGISHTDPVYLWLSGATQANEGVGAYSAFIRTYTATQYKLRFGNDISTQGSDLMQQASNAVATSVITSIISSNGQIPTIANIARNDATSVGDVVFSSMPSDTAYIKNAAWSGAVLFPMLSSDQTSRLMSTGDPAKVDTLNDWRDVLFAYDSAEAALGAAVAAYALDGASQLAIDTQILGEVAASAIRAGGGMSGVETLFAHSPVFSAIQSIFKYGENNFLGWIVDAYANGQNASGGNFEQAASLWASSMGQSGVNINGQIESPSQIAADAKTSGSAGLAARNALLNLDPFVVTGSSSIYKYQTAYGAGGLSDRWISDRTLMLDLIMQGAANGQNARGILSVTDPALADTIYMDDGTGISVSALPSSGSLDTTHIVKFANNAGESIAGGALSDDLFGGSGNDTLVGAGGNDYLEAGLGNDSLEGDAGNDTLIGGSGNDTLNGGADNDLLEAGSGNTTLIGGTGNDTLIAGDGSDILEGDAGNNSLVGGKGFDIFSFFSSDKGNNVITDTTGNGELLFDGAVLNGGTEIGPNEWQSGNVTYQLQPGKNGKSDLLITLTNQQTVLIQGYTAGTLGITLGDQNTPPIIPSSGSANVDVQVIGNDTYYSSSDSSAPSVMNIASAADGGINKIVATGNSSIFGSASEDLIRVADGTNYIVGGGGPDGILSGNGNSTIYAGSVLSAAQLVADTGTGVQGTLVATGDGNNTIYGSQGDDVIYTGSGNNLIYTGAGDDILNLSSPDRTYTISKNWESYEYADGRVGDIVDVEGTVNVSGGPKSGSGLVPPGYEGAIDFATPNHPNGAGNNTVIGGTGNNLVMLSNGNNLVELNSGNSTVWGGMGSDTIFSGSGSDVIFGGGGDSYVVAGSGNQHIYGEGGNNVIYGGSGNDTIYAGDNPAFRTGTAGYNYVEAGSGNTLIFGSSLSDSLYGGDGNDTINAGDGTEYIDGGEGNNQLFAGTGADTLVSSGSGNDSLVGNSGFVTMIGGSGTDYFYLNGPTATGDAIVYAGDGSAGTGTSMVYGGTGNATVIGGAGALQVQGGSGDLLVDLTQSDGENPVSVFAGSGDTTVYGGEAPVYIVGGSGNDELYAGDGGTDDSASYVQAGSGDSSLYGGAGSAELDASQTSANDLLVGGDGHTIMLGGSGSNTFVAGAGETDITLGSGSNLIQTAAGDGDIYISGAQAATTIQFDAATSVVNISLEQGTNSNGTLEWYIVTPDGSLYLPTALAASTSFQFADGTTLSFKQLMAQSSYVNDGAGNVTSRYYSDAGKLTGDDWTKTDGSSGSDTIAADGSMQSNATYITGYTSTTSTDPAGNATFIQYDPSGNESGSGTKTIDSSGLITTDFTSADGTSTVTIQNVDGSLATTSYDATLNKTSDSWSKADGTSGYDIFNNDGSSSGRTSNADGSSSNYTNDGQGGIVTQFYNASGVETSIDSQDAVGGTTVLTMNADGSAIEVANDGVGNVSTSWLDTYGNLTADTWTSVDGSHGDDTFDYGTRTGTTYNVDGTTSSYIDDGQGDITSTNFNAQGIVTGDVWQNRTGAKGTDSFNADGSSSGTQVNPGGNYSQYTNDGQGNSTVVDYASTGAKVDDSWSKADGSSGTDQFFLDGSSTGTVTNADGSLSKYSDDGRGDTFNQTFNSVGASLGDTWHNADGSYGSTVIDPVTEKSITTVTDVHGVTTTWDGTGPVNPAIEFGTVYEADASIASLEKTYESTLSNSIYTRNQYVYDSVSPPTIEAISDNNSLVPGEVGTGGFASDSESSKTVTTTARVLVTRTTYVEDYFIPWAQLWEKYGGGGFLSSADLPLGQFRYEQEPNPNLGGSDAGPYIDVPIGYEVEKPVTTTTPEWVTTTTTVTHSTGVLAPIEQIQAGASNQTVFLGDGQEAVNASGNNDLIGPDHATPYSATDVIVEQLQLYFSDGSPINYGGYFVDGPLHYGYTDQGIGSFINASGQNDTVIGTQSNDTIVCGAGNDFINGGGGSDTYLVYPVLTNGWDVIDDTVTYSSSTLAAIEQEPGLSWVPLWNEGYGGPALPVAPVNTFAFESGVTPAQLQFDWSQVAQAGNQWALDISWGGNGGIRIVMNNEDNAAFTFQNGTTLSMSDILAMAPPRPESSGVVNTGTLPVQNEFENQLFSYALPANVFAAASNASGPLSFAVTQPDGTPLPGWLGFDPASQTLTGFPPAGSEGSLQLTLTGTDSLGNSSSTPLVLTIQAADPGTNPTALTTTNDDGSYSVSMTVDGTRTVINDYSAGGVLIGNSWTDQDGSYGSVTFNPDGSSSGSATEPDSSNLIYSADGQGNTLIQQWSSQWQLTGDVWSHQDGSHGTDSFNADGSSTGEGFYTDGRYSHSTNDGFGNITTELFSVAGVHIGEDWSKGDGTHGSTTFNADGSSTGTVVSVDDTYSTFVNDGSGNIHSLFFSADGTQIAHGTTNPDGSGARFNNDGTYSYFANDGHGNADTEYFSAAGALTQATWTEAGGVSGTDVVNADGSSSGNWSSIYGSTLGFTSSLSNDVTAHADASSYYQTDLVAGNGNDNIVVNGGTSNVITLGSGTDSVTINVGTAATVNAGNGVETITSNSTYWQTLNLGNVATDHVWFQRSGANLVISVLGQNEKVTLNGWYTNTYAVFGETQAGNHQIVASDVNRLVSAMAAFSPPTASQTALTTQEQQQLQPLLASVWH